MKVLFLDIDGVLNHEKHYQWLHYSGEATSFQKTHPYCNFNPVSVKLLNKIIDETGCEIVLSSSWRFDGITKINNIFDKVGIKHKIIDVTPSLGSLCRGKEIDKWLSEHPEVTKYVIVDDDTDMEEHQLDFFVNTDANEDGLNKNLTNKIIELLK